MGLHANNFILQVLGGLVAALLLTEKLRLVFLHLFQVCNLAPMTTRENSTPLRYGASPLRDTLRRSAFSRRLGEKVLWGRIVPESRVASISACEPLAVSVRSRLRYVQEIQAPSIICLSLSAEETDV